jgi:putative ABC transport system ATP-binding protein
VSSPSVPSPIVSVISVRHLHHRYSTPGGELRVLDDVSCDISRGSLVAIMGPSGSGKTTLLSILGGLERPQSGAVAVGGSDLGLLASDELAAFRRATVGFVFQDFGLLASLTALENVELALTLGRIPRARRRSRARELLEAVGLAARADHRPHALSGGENQRVAIARALANAPPLVLADEPTGNLDTSSTLAVLDLIGRLPVDHDCTVVVVTHDPIVATRAERVLELVDGRLQS